MEIWRTDPLYCQFYHESGLIWVDGKGFARTVIKNYERLGAKEKVRMASPDEVRTLYGGLFANAELDDCAEILINESSGWVEASKCLEAVIATAAHEGVRCVKADVSTLEFDSTGSCVGVRSRDGKVINANRVILASGAQTAKLLVDSFPNPVEPHVGDRFVAAALCTGMVKLNAEEAERFKAGPIFLHAAGNSQGVNFPANAENELKFTRDVSFTNTFEHASGLRISMPPDGPLYSQRAVPQSLKDELKTVAQGIFGTELDKWELENHRICWDAITPTQDFIICPHPESKNLFLATGGSFHAWKFFPLLGKYVVEMLEGGLSDEMTKRWAWDKHYQGFAHTRKGIVPRREMRDLL